MPYVRGHCRHTPSGSFTYASPHYGTSHYRHNLDGTLGFVGIGFFIGLAALLLAIVKAAAANTTAPLIALGGIAGTYCIAFFIYSLRKLQFHHYLGLCTELSTEGTLDPSRLAKMESLANRLPANSRTRRIKEEAIYRNLVAQILADGRIDEQERSVLCQLEQTFVFDPGTA